MVIKRLFLRVVTCSAPGLGSSPSVACLLMSSRGQDADWPLWVGGSHAAAAVRLRRTVDDLKSWKSELFRVTKSSFVGILLLLCGLTRPFSSRAVPPPQPAVHTPSAIFRIGGRSFPCYRSNCPVTNIGFRMTLILGWQHLGGKTRPPRGGQQRDVTLPRADTRHWTLLNAQTTDNRLFCSG